MITSTALGVILAEKPPPPPFFLSLALAPAPTPKLIWKLYRNKDIRTLIKLFKKEAV